jgi:octopine/nopaline transport system permease protein
MRQPFDFFITAAALYLAITSLSGVALERVERRLNRGIRRA